MMDNIPNLRLEVLKDYVLSKRNVCSPAHPSADMFLFSVSRLSLKLKQFRRDVGSKQNPSFKMTS